MKISLTLRACLVALMPLTIATTTLAAEHPVLDALAATHSSLKAVRSAVKKAQPVHRFSRFISNAIWGKGKMADQQAANFEATIRKPMTPALTGAGLAIVKGLRRKPVTAAFFFSTGCLTSLWRTTQIMQEEMHRRFNEAQHDREHKHGEAMTNLGGIKEEIFKTQGGIESFETEMKKRFNGVLQNIDSGFDNQAERLDSQTELLKEEMVKQTTDLTEKMDAQTQDINGNVQKLGQDLKAHTTEETDRVIRVIEKGPK